MNQVEKRKGKYLYLVVFPFLIEVYGSTRGMIFRINKVL